MNLAVFTGPSLSHAEARAILPDATILPPAVRGDIYRAARWGARVIVLIDGAFEMVPAVMHTEVLWVLSQGVHVYGASSMGALRAAELNMFGMIGIGRIYDSYASGDLEADDEVAVLLGPEELGFPALTEPMVNIRATLAAAVADNVISDAIADALITASRSIFFKERTFDELLARARRSIDVAALEAWLPVGRVDQKRLDAIALLNRVAADRARGLEPHRPNFKFVATSVWLRLKERIDQELEMRQT